jgi:hypothetical protein
MPVLDTIYIYVCFYSRSVIIVCSSFSLSLLISSFRPYRSQKRRKKTHHFIAVVFSLFSLSFSAENTSCFCIYIYINQKKCERLRAASFSCCIGQIWPRHYYYPDSSIRFCVCLRTRIECAYTYTRTKRNHQ